MNIAPVSLSPSNPCGLGRFGNSAAFSPIGNILMLNTGKTVTCYTSGDHLDEDGFTGLVASVSNDTVYLLSCSRANHCDRRYHHGCRREPFYDCPRCCNHRRDDIYFLREATNTTLAIPISRITAVAVCST